MSDDGAVVEKKGRGRPRANEDGKESKKRGKSIAEKSQAKKEDGEAPAKRGRGRPPKAGKAKKAATKIKVSMI